jgi:hypothetical protein
MRRRSPSAFTFTSLLNLERHQLEAAQCAGEAEQRQHVIAPFAGGAVAGAE